MTQAQQLAEVIRYFNPQQPLKAAQLQEWYVNRPGNPLAQMRTYLQGLALNDVPVKILFTGHVGCGKSTELNQLAEAIKNQFFIVSLDIRDSLSLADLTYVDLVLGMATALFRRATEPDVLGKYPGQITADYWADLTGFIENTIFGPAYFRTAAPDREAAVKVNVLAAEFQAKFASEASTRESIRRHVEPRLAELHAKIDEVSGLVRTKFGRPVLFFVEGTDKTDLARARDIFLNHTYSLTNFRASVVYTIPISLRYSNDFTLLRDQFNEIYVLPNLNVKKHSGGPDLRGLAMLDQALMARLSPRLIDNPARRAVVEASGGLLRTLIKLTQRAAVNALAAGETRIVKRHAEAAINEERADYIAGLKADDYPVLLARAKDQQLTADEPVLRLLQTRALLEYANDHPWCDVHPIVSPLLRQWETASPAADNA